jgi:hypothetical protein
MTTSAVPSVESALAKLRARTADSSPHIGYASISHEEAAALLARLDALEWQPIETAPKDGAWFLAWRAHETRPRIVRWDATYDAAESEFGEHVYHLERWMPLPAYRNPVPTAEEE